MSDLLAGFNGAIPIGKLRGNIHKRFERKTSPAKSKESPVLKGGEDLLIEKLEDEESIDKEPEDVLKIENTEEKEIVNELSREEVAEKKFVPKESTIQTSKPIKKRRGQFRKTKQSK